MPDPRTARTGFASPFEVASAWRTHNPGKFDDVGDDELIRAIEKVDPETYKLIDPLLYGAENLPVPKAPPPAPRLVPPSPDAGKLPLASRIVPAITGTGLGFLAGGPVGAAIGGGVGAFGGEGGAQYLEKEAGPREEYSPASMVFEGVLGAANPALRAETTLGRIGAQAAFGAGLGAVGTVGRSLIEDTPITPEDVAMNTLLGGAFGGATHAGFEGAGAGMRALRNRAPNFGDVLPPIGPEGMRTPVDDLVIQQAAAQQYRQEEATLAKQLTELFGPEALTTGAKYGDLHTATQAKTYLEELAKLTEAREAAERAVEDARAAAIRGATPEETALFAPPTQKQLPPGPPSFIGYPPGATPQIDEVPGWGIRPGIIANEPPPDPLEETLAAALSQPPGPPRLVTDKPYQALQLEAPGGAGAAELGLPPQQPNLLPRTRKPLGRIQQTGEMGGAPPTFEAPHLQGLEPRPLAERSYTEGPNAGPRREGEAHGTPRELRRMVETAGKSTREVYPSTRPAEDPGTYPADVRRELAVMAQELDDYRYEQIPGGSTRGQLDALTEETGNISTAIATARRKGVTSGGAVAGAPVYHDIIGAAEGAFKHVKRDDMLAQIKAALLEGRGNGLTDAAAQVARQRLAARATAASHGLETRGGRQALKEARIIHAQDAGDSLINWHDLQGRPTRGRELSPYEQAAREMTNQEIRTAEQVWQETQGRVSEESDEWFQAVRNEGKNRGIIREEQPGLRMEGPGGAGGPSLFDFEGGQVRIKKGASFRDDGNWDVTLPNGKQTKIFYDKASQTWYEDKPTTQQFTSHYSDLFGFTKEELLEKLAQREAGPATAPPKQPSLPGAEKVRQQNIPTPEVADLPFALQPPPSKPGAAAPQGDLFGPPPAKPKLSLKEAAKNELKSLFDDESGELILGLPPAGDRRGLKAWMKQLEESQGGETWYNRVEQAIEDGDWDRAWKTAAGAMVRQYTKARAAATTPQQQAALAQAVKGTILQEDLSAQIIAVARQGQVRRPAPRVTDLPPSYQVTTRQQGQGMELGPAGIINPGPPTMPPPRKGRAQVLDTEIMDTFAEAVRDQPDLIHLIRGNRDQALRLGRQITDLVVQGQYKLDPADFPNMTREEIGRQYLKTLSEAGRTLGKFGNLVHEFEDEFYEAQDKMDIGGALGITTKRYLPGTQRPMTKDIAAAMDRVAQQSKTPEVATALLQQDLQKPSKWSMGDALMNSTYPFITGTIPGAIRNITTTMARYSFDLLDHALTASTGSFIGEPKQAALSQGILRERLTRRPTNFSVTPYRAAWAQTFEDIYNLHAATYAQMAQSDARRVLKVVSEIPDAAMHLIGFAGGEDLAASKTNSTILNTLMNPKLQRWLTLWNRAQEFTSRGLTFDTHFRAQLRARGIDPIAALQNPSKANLAKLVGGEEELTRMFQYAGDAALEMTWAGQMANRSIPGALVNMVQGFWPAKLVQKFPRFNYSAAPRWLYDHSPAALLDLVRLPFDRAGITSSTRWGGGRLYRGLKGQQYETDIIPALHGEISKVQGQLGDALTDLQATSREWSVRQRQVKRLEARAQTNLPGTQTALDDAIQARDLLARKRDGLKAEIARHKLTINGRKGSEGQEAIEGLRQKEARYWAEVQNATGISAPTWSTWASRMVGGTFGMLGAAIVMRSQEGAEGTRYYQYRIGKRKEEGGNPWTLDLRGFAPFVQYLMVADVLVDFWRHTNWEKAQAEAGNTGTRTAAGVGGGAAAGAVMGGPVGAAAGALVGGAGANLVPWSEAIWNNYEGKYTRELLGAEFGSAFLSISRAAGTTLTIADLLTRNGWPSFREAGDALLGTMGQHLAGYASAWPIAAAKDIAGGLSEEEATIRSVPRSTLRDPASLTYSLAEGLGRIPGVSQVIPPTYSQTSGKPIKSAHPVFKLATGVSVSEPDFIQEELRRIGMPGSSFYFRETGDVAFDQLLFQVYNRIAEDRDEGLPTLLEDPEYRKLSPANQRDRMQEVLPNLKREALGEVKELLGLERVEEAMTSPAEARRKKRQAALAAELDAEAGVGGELAPFDAPEPAPPGPPPPAPF